MVFAILKKLPALTTCTILIVAGSSAVARATDFTLKATDQGWWSDTDQQTNGGPNYIVGSVVGSPSPLNYRNFFTFDLSSLTDRSITSAVLRLQRGQGAGDPIVQYGLFDVSTSTAALREQPISPLTNAPNRFNPIIFADLGSGTSYGTYNVSTSGNPTDLLAFGLNSEAVTDLNRSIGNSFSIGGTLINPNPQTNQYLFGFSGTYTADLEVTTEAVPEPIVFPGAMIALGLGTMLHRKSKAMQRSNAKR